MQRNFALLIGTGQFTARSGSFPALVTPAYDVEQLAKALTAAPAGIFSVDDVEVLINRTSGEIIGRLEAFTTKKVKKNDLLLIYFSGHGHKDSFSGRLYLTGKNSRKDRIVSTGISWGILQELLYICPSQKVIVVLDCCYSGAAELTKGDEAGAVERLAQTGAGRYVLSSSGASQESWIEEPDGGTEGQRLSVFTRYLIEGIHNEAADADDDGRIAVDEWFEYASAMTVLRKPQQNPVIRKSAVGDPLFVATSQKQRPRAASPMQPLVPEDLDRLSPKVRAKLLSCYEGHLGPGRDHWVAPDEILSPVFHQSGALLICARGDSIARCLTII